MLFLLLVCLIMLLAGYAIVTYYGRKGQAPQELKTGVQVLTNPESVVKDLE